eukprot:SAG22_NODE_745_length_7499_cov_2.796622_4_plen_83_part_00
MVSAMLVQLYPTVPASRSSAMTICAALTPPLPLPIFSSPPTPAGEAIVNFAEKNGAAEAINAVTGKSAKTRPSGGGQWRSGR